MQGTLWNALIRTHHITSRKKVARLRQAATQHSVAVLLCSGGSPGVMYVEGVQTGVEEWVQSVKRLRYKDFHLAARPAEIQREGPFDQDTAGAQPASLAPGVSETDSVQDFAVQMRQRSVYEWWRRAMGYPDRHGEQE